MPSAASQPARGRLLSLGVLAATSPLLLAIALSFASELLGFIAGALLALVLGVSWIRRAKSVHFIAAIFGGVLTLLQIGLAALGAYAVHDALVVLGGNIPMAMPQELAASEEDVVRIQGAMVRSELHGAQLYEGRNSSNVTYKNLYLVAPLVGEDWSTGKSVSAWIGENVTVEDSTQEAESYGVEQLASLTQFLHRADLDPNLEAARRDAVARHGLQQVEGAPIFSRWEDPTTGVWGTLIFAFGGLFACNLAMILLARMNPYEP